MKEGLKEGLSHFIALNTAENNNNERSIKEQSRKPAAKEGENERKGDAGGGAHATILSLRARSS